MLTKIIFEITFLFKMAANAPLEVSLCESKSCKITKLRVQKGSKVAGGTLLALYTVENQVCDQDDGRVEQKLKSQYVGTVEEVLFNEGDVIEPGYLHMNHVYLRVVKKLNLQEDNLKV